MTGERPLKPEQEHQHLVRLQGHLSIFREFDKCILESHEETISYFLSIEDGNDSGIQKFAGIRIDLLNSHPRSSLENNIIDDIF